MNEKRDLDWVPLFLGLFLIAAFLAGFFVLYLFVELMFFQDPENSITR